MASQEGEHHRRARREAKSRLRYVQTCTTLSYPDVWGRSETRFRGRSSGASARPLAIDGSFPNVASKLAAPLDHPPPRRPDNRVLPGTGALECEQRDRFPPT